MGHVSTEPNYTGPPVPNPDEGYGTGAPVMFYMQCEMLDLLMHVSSRENSGPFYSRDEAITKAQELGYEATIYNDFGTIIAKWSPLNGVKNVINNKEDYPVYED